MNETRKFEIMHYPWDFNGYKPPTAAEVTRDDDGFSVHFVSYETELTAVQTKHNTDIYLDSAVEVFIAFSPDTNENYINFEVNSNGAMHCGLGGGRHNRIMIAPEEIATLGISTEIFPDRWEAKFRIGIEFIKKIYPEYRHGCRIAGNFYKTGENAKYPHWGSWRETGTENPDFHRPESFGTIFDGE